MALFKKKPIEDAYEKPIILSTGNVYRQYEIIDVLIAMDSSTEKWFKAADPAEAFDGVKSILCSKCRALDGDAVINCQFEYRMAINSDVLAKQVLELFAYGTAVRFIDE